MLNTYSHHAFFPLLLEVILKASKKWSSKGQWVASDVPKVKYSNFDPTKLCPNLYTQQNVKQIVLTQKIFTCMQMLQIHWWLLGWLIDHIYWRCLLSSRDHIQSCTFRQELMVDILCTQYAGTLQLWFSLFVQKQSHLSPPRRLQIHVAENLSEPLFFQDPQQFWFNYLKRQ